MQNDPLRLKGLTISIALAMINALTGLAERLQEVCKNPPLVFTKPVSKFLCCYRYY